LKIAVDNQISKDIVKRLIKKGYNIVLRAQDEPDEQWVEAALDLGANVIVSPDVDIPILLDRLGADDVRWIDVPRYKKKENLEKYLIKAFK
jgi:riboflavin biosynthesis pyrimidine reductase